ncbi:hypothetical protein [Paraburkholderia sp. Tr-20389]|uniref:hypothetical protein n=1 Tax=Paraburkholderia sp. Tr-20389 TaxID=2703903 RepID=UPI001F11E661|nr:hypothetical protein [Paraburkholderia sp. Tr-20389]
MKNHPQLLVSRLFSAPLTRRGDGHLLFVHPFIDASLRPPADRLDIVRRIQRPASSSSGYTLKINPVQIGSKFLTAHSCKILDNQAFFFRGSARNPVRNRLGLNPKRFGESERSAVLLDGGTQRFGSGVWFRCLHAHSISHAVSLDKIFRELFL